MNFALGSSVYIDDLADPLKSMHFDECILLQSNLIGLKKEWTKSIKTCEQPRKIWKAWRNVVVYASYRGRGKILAILHELS